MTKARSEKEEQVVTEESRPSEPDPKNARDFSPHAVVAERLKYAERAHQNMRRMTGRLDTHEDSLG